MGYDEFWGHRIWSDTPVYSEPEEVDCPRCGSTVEWGEVKPCEWCNEVGCPNCMVSTIDGMVCSEACAKALRRAEDRTDRRWDLRIKRLKRKREKEKDNVTDQEE